MKHLTTCITLVASTVLGVAVASAQTTTNLTITPASPIFDSNNVAGVSFDAAPDYPTGSFASNGVAKTDMYFTPEALFLRPVTLGEVASMSYWTKTGEMHDVDPRDWYIAIYTKPYAGDASSASWYGDRIGSEPYFSINLNDPADTWNQWTTGGAENKLRFFESTAGAPGATFGSYTDPDWATFVAGNALSGDPYGGARDPLLLGADGIGLGGWLYGATGWASDRTDGWFSSDSQLRESDAPDEQERLQEGRVAVVDPGGRQCVQEPGRLHPVREHRKVDSIRRTDTSRRGQPPGCPRPCSSSRRAVTTNRSTVARATVTPDRVRWQTLQSVTAPLLCRNCHPQLVATAIPSHSPWRGALDAAFSEV